MLLCVWPGHKAGVRPSPEIRPGRRDSAAWLQATAHHRLLHPKPGAQEDPGENPVDTVCRQKPGFRRKVGGQNWTLSLCRRSQTSPWGCVNRLLIRNQQRAVDASACVAWDHFIMRSKRPPWAMSLKDAKPLPLKLCLLSSIHIHEWKKLISLLSSILSKIIKFMCVRGLNRSLRRSVSLLLSAPTSDSLGSV